MHGLFRTVSTAADLRPKKHQLPQPGKRQTVGRQRFLNVYIYIYIYIYTFRFLNNNMIIRRTVLHLRDIINIIRWSFFYTKQLFATFFRGGGR
jgi:hypothetical protein